MNTTSYTSITPSRLTAVSFERSARQKKTGAAAAKSVPPRLRYRMNEYNARSQKAAARRAALPEIYVTAFVCMGCRAKAAAAMSAVQ